MKARAGAIGHDRLPHCTCSRSILRRKKLFVPPQEEVNELEEEDQQEDANPATTADAFSERSRGASVFEFPFAGT